MNRFYRRKWIISHEMLQIQTWKSHDKAAMIKKLELSLKQIAELVQQLMLVRQQLGEAQEQRMQAGREFRWRATVESQTKVASLWKEIQDLSTQREELETKLRKEEHKLKALGRNNESLAAEICRLWDDLTADLGPSTLSISPNPVNDSFPHFTLKSPAGLGPDTMSIGATTTALQNSPIPALVNINACLARFEEAMKASGVVDLKEQGHKLDLDAVYLVVNDAMNTLQQERVQLLDRLEATNASVDHLEKQLTVHTLNGDESFMRLLVKRRSWSQCSSNIDQEENGHEGDVDHGDDDDNGNYHQPGDTYINETENDQFSTGIAISNPGERQTLCQENRESQAEACGLENVQHLQAKLDAAVEKIKLMESRNAHLQSQLDTIKQDLDANRNNISDDKKPDQRGGALVVQEGTETEDWQQQSTEKMLAVMPEEMASSALANKSLEEVLKECRDSVADQIHKGGVLSNSNASLTLALENQTKINYDLQHRLGLMTSQIMRLEGSEASLRNRLSQVADEASLLADANHTLEQELIGIKKDLGSQSSRYIEFGAKAEVQEKYRKLEAVALVDQEGQADCEGLSQHKICEMEMDFAPAAERHKSLCETFTILSKANKSAEKELVAPREEAASLQEELEIRDRELAEQKQLCGDSSSSNAALNSTMETSNVHLDMIGADDEELSRLPSRQEAQDGDLQGAVDHPVYSEGCRIGINELDFGGQGSNIRPTRDHDNLEHLAPHLLRTPFAFNDEHDSGHCPHQETTGECADVEIAYHSSIRLTL